MSQLSPRFCPQCNAPVAENQRFCSNCGSTIEPGFSSPTAAAGSGEYWQNSTVPAPEAPPPPPGQYMSPAQQYSYPPYTEQAGQAVPQVPLSYPPPSYATPGKDSSGSVLRQISCGVLAVILLVLVICGGLAYGGYLLLRSAAGSAPTTTGTGTQNGNNPGGTPAPIKTIPINQSINYASVDITILNVQQSTSFVDDPNTNQPGVVRLNIKESNAVVDATGVNDHGFLNYDYSSAYRLLLPDGTSAAPVNAQKSSGPAQGVTQTNWIDFPVPTSIKVSQLVLRLGTASEAQMDVPLTDKADLSQYQPKKVTLNLRTQYGGMFWTLTSATAQLNEAGKQADKGMRFIVVMLKIDNPTSQDVNSYPPDYVRLRYSAGTASPIGNTAIPIRLTAGTTNVAGSAAFLVPQGGSTFTLILLQNGLTGATSQATINFQIQ